MNKIVLAQYDEYENVVRVIDIFKYNDGDRQIWNDFTWLAKRGLAVYAYSYSYDKEGAKTLAITDAYRDEGKKIKTKTSQKNEQHSSSKIY